MPYRVQGMLGWVLEHLRFDRCTIVGALSTEERCLAAWRFLRESGTLHNTLLMQVDDVPNPKWHRDTKDRLESMMETFEGEGGARSQVEAFPLFGPYGKVIERMLAVLDTRPRNLMVDISSLPKRFFFPILKTILSRKSAVRNLMVTYTRADHYTPGRLAEDPEPWKHIPMFPPPFPEPKRRMLILGLGWDALGLPKLLKGEDQDATTVRIMLPFPALNPGYRRNWQVVRMLEPTPGQAFTHAEPIRIDAYDVPEVYDRISALTDGGQTYAIFAPFGPKPMSLAMCLHAIYHPSSSSVFYTQPKSYNPDYSRGVSVVRGTPQVHAYCLRLGGKDLYRP